MVSLHLSSFLFIPFSLIIRPVESFLFTLVRLYDAYMYSPLQTLLWPWVQKVPRSLNIRGRQINVFTANIVSWARTLLVIPIAFTLKYGYYWTGFWLVIFHDFLDHVDGIVAKVHRQQYGQVDDPIIGGFMDAFCDKIVNVLSLWSILMVTDFTPMTTTQSSIYLGSCAIIIAYEFTLGVVRVQDFFRAYYLREFKKIDCSSSKTSTAAVMEGKLKEKLESMGIAALCLAQSNPVVLGCTSGIIGVTCLVLSVRLAHSSLASKLQARASQMRSRQHASDDEDEIKHQEPQQQQQQQQRKVVKKLKSEACSQTDLPVDSSCGNIKEDSLTSRISRQNSANKRFDDTQYTLCDDPSNTHNSNTGADSDPDVDTESDCEQTKHHDLDLKRCVSMPETVILNDLAVMDTRVERIYTIGCFDLFHHGHRTLIGRMKTMGKKVVIGVHDSNSIHQLKKRIPIDSTITRMKNVRQHADEVFCVAGTDPAPFITCIFDSSHSTASAMYVRGDDMPQFPARQLCERLMTVKFLPYTQGVSSTKLRKELLNSNNSDRLRSIDDASNDHHVIC